MMIFVFLLEILAIFKILDTGRRIGYFEKLQLIFLENNKILKLRANLVSPHGCVGRLGERRDVCGCERASGRPSSPSSQPDGHRIGYFENYS